MIYSEGVIYTITIQNSKIYKPNLRTSRLVYCQDYLKTNHLALTTISSATCLQLFTQTVEFIHFNF